MLSYRQNIKQKLLLQIEILSERNLHEVLDFARFLSYHKQPIDEQKVKYQKSQPEIIKPGLRHWQETEPAPLTPRQQVEQIWATAGLIVPLDPTISHRYPQPPPDHTPAQAGGKPASQIIIEQRGEL